MNLLARKEIQKRVETFAGKLFPGYSVARAARDDRGRPLYSPALIPNITRYRVSCCVPFNSWITGTPAETKPETRS